MFLRLQRRLNISASSSVPGPTFSPFILPITPQGWCHDPHFAGKEMPTKRAWVANPGPIASGQQSWVTNKSCLGFNAMVSPWGHRHSWQNPGVNWVSSQRPHPVQSFCLSISPSPSSSINSHRSSHIFHPKWVVTGNADMVHGSPLQAQASPGWRRPSVCLWRRANANHLLLGGADCSD